MMSYYSMSYKWEAPFISDPPTPPAKSFLIGISKPSWPNPIPLPVPIIYLYTSVAMRSKIGKTSVG